MLEADDVPRIIGDRSDTERPYRLLVEEMQQGAATLSGTRAILYCNRRFAEMLQGDPAQLAGAPFETFVMPASHDAWQALVRDAARARAAGELELRRRDGSALPALAAVSPMASPDGTSLGVVLADLTERKHFERLLAAERQLIVALAAAEEAAHAKDRFLAVLGHELRNPLGPIRNSVLLMKMAGASGPIIESARLMIDRQVTLMARLLDDLLDVSRIASGKITLRMAPLDLAAVVAEVVADHRPLLEGSGLKLDFSPPEPLPAFGDAARIAQIVANLLVNANKFTDPGGRVTVGLASDDQGGAVISVRDTGIGIDPANLEHLFEQFMQADQSIDRSRGGLGLGLALVKGLAELHGGRIRVSSAGLGLGSEFSVQLPRRLGQLKPPPATPAPEPGPAGALRILIVEDNADAAETLRMLLAFAGHAAEVAHTGAEGLERASGFRPQVVLCDIGLPGGMDGYAVAAALRARPELGPVRLIAMTGFGQDQDRRLALAAGFDHHLTKPADPEALLRLLALYGGQPETFQF